VNFKSRRSLVFLPAILAVLSYCGWNLPVGKWRVAREIRGVRNSSEAEAFVRKYEMNRAALEGEWLHGYLEDHHSMIAGTKVVDVVWCFEPDGRVKSVQYSYRTHFDLRDVWNSL
jgi:hypothetical protein